MADVLRRGEGTLTEVSLESSRQGAPVEVIKEVPVPTKATGDPQVLGWLVFVVGSTCLGLELVGFVNQGALGAPLPIIAGNSMVPATRASKASSERPSAVCSWSSIMPPAQHLKGGRGVVPFGKRDCR